MSAIFIMEIYKKGGSLLINTKFVFIIVCCFVIGQLSRRNAEVNITVQSSPVYMDRYLQNVNLHAAFAFTNYILRFVNYVEFKEIIRK